MTSLFKNLSKDPDSVSLDIKSDEEVVISQQSSEVSAYTNKGNIFSYKAKDSKTLKKKEPPIVIKQPEKINISVPSVCQYTEYITNDLDNSRIINKTFPNIYVISLLEDGNVKRITHTKYVLKKMGANYIICFMSRLSDEIYVDYLKEHNKLEELNLPTHRLKKLSKSELGCLFSHAWVLNNLENTNIKQNHTSSSKLHLILEDDIMPIRNFDNKLQKIVSQTPDIINGKLMMLASTDYHISCREIKHETYIPQGDKLICGAGAYALSSESAKKIAEEMTYCLKPADHYFNAIFDSLKGKSEGFVVYPPLIWLDISQSTIGNERILDSEEYILKLDRCYPGIDLEKYDILPLSLLDNDIYINKIKTLLESSNYIQDLESAFKTGDLTEHNWLKVFKRSSWSREYFIDFFNEISPTVEIYFPPKDLAVCVVFFNPSNRIRPVQNILYCISKIVNRGIEVYILELVYEGRTPELQHLPNYYKIVSNSLMFHKENLWNILETKIPEKYKKLLFLDGDVLFKDSDWPNKISNILNNVEVCQPFSTVELLDVTYRVLDTKLSCMKAKEKRPTEIFDNLFKYATPGFGFACRRSWFHKIGGFHDLCVMGGGDRFMISSICNRNMTKDICFIEQPYSNEQYDSKKQHFTDVVYGSLDLTIQHLFHGRYKDRQYGTRHKKTKDLTKDDLYKTDEGLIQFVDPKKWNPIVLEYFNNRNDDGI